MAIKNQCEQCTHYNENQCNLTAYTPVYDCTSCEKYIHKGINLEKVNRETSPSNEQQTSKSENASCVDSSKKQSMFAHPFSFKGRIGRLEYGCSYLIYRAYCLPIQLMPEDADSDGWMAVTIIGLMLLLPMLWFLYAQSAKRCHDRGHSAWFMFVPFYVFWLLFGKGDSGTNEYGDSPQ